MPPLDKLNVVTADSLEEIESIRPMWEQMQCNEPYPAPSSDIDRYLSVVKAHNSDLRPYIMVLERNGCPAAMMIGCIEKDRVELRFGYRTLLRPRLKCLSVVYGGILGERTSDICTSLVRELMNTLKRGDIDAVFINHITTSSPIYQTATKMPSLLCQSYLARADRHWSMSIHKNVDLMYQSLTPKSRNTLRRKIRKLERGFADKLNIVDYRDKDDLADAMSAASYVSKHTYQAGLGVGFVNDSQTREILAVAAEHGWLRMSILHIEDEPCAFQLGLRYGKTYFLEKLGFLPRWKQWNVGTVLFVKVLEDLCRDPLAERFDFGFGDAQYKSTYGSECWDEASVYIFAPRPYPVFINALRRSMHGLSRGLMCALDRFGLVNSVKRHWRSQLGATNPHTES